MEENEREVLEACEGDEPARAPGQDSISIRCRSMGVTVAVAVGAVVVTVVVTVVVSVLTVVETHWRLLSVLVTPRGRE